MGQTYIIKQKIKETHTNQINNKYFVGKSLNEISFSDNEQEATAYTTKEDAKKNLKRIFSRVPFHINIQYEIVTLH